MSPNAHGLQGFRRADAEIGAGLGKTTQANVRRSLHVLRTDETQTHFGPVVPDVLRLGMNATQKLRQLHGEITQARDGFRVVDSWTLAKRLLSRLPVDQTEVTRVCSAQDADGFDALIKALESPPAPVEKPLKGFTQKERDAAMGAFKRRLKIVQLNDESRLGGRYTSGGRKSGIDAIEPPKEFDREVWAALAAEGRLERVGGGMYALAPGEPRT